MRLAWRRAELGLRPRIQGIQLLLQMPVVGTVQDLNARARARRRGRVNAQRFVADRVTVAPARAAVGPVGPARVPERRRVAQPPTVRPRRMAAWAEGIQGFVSPVLGIQGFVSPVLFTGLPNSQIDGLVLDGKDIVAIVPRVLTQSTEVWSADESVFVGNPWDEGSGQSRLLRDVLVAPSDTAAQLGLPPRKRRSVGVDPFVLPVVKSTRPRTLAHYSSAWFHLAQARMPEEILVRLLAQWLEHIEVVETALSLAEMARSALGHAASREIPCGADRTLEDVLRLKDPVLLQEWIESAELLARASRAELQKRAGFFED